MDTAPDLPAMELTRSTLDGTHGFICREHAVTRTGLAERHALNVEAKHLREHHADQAAATLEVNLSAIARTALMSAAEASRTAEGRLLAWMDLTGLDYTEAMQLAQTLVIGRDADVLAYVSPL